MAPCSRILARIIPRAEESGGLQPMGPKESDTTKQLNNSLSCLLGNLRDVSYSPLSAIHTLQGLNKCFVVIVQSLSHVWLFVTPWSVAHQAPLPMGLSWQEYWSRLPFPSPRDFPNPGIEPKSLASLALADGFLTSASHGEPYHSTQTWGKSIVLKFHREGGLVRKNMSFWLHHLGDLSSPTSDWTWAPSVRALSPNHWKARELQKMS